MEMITHRDCGDENDHGEALLQAVANLAPLPATIITLKGTRIYPPANGSLYIVKRKGIPALGVFSLSEAIDTAHELERMQ
jgi:hypothetical protein